MIDRDATVNVHDPQDSRLSEAQRAALTHVVDLVRQQQSVSRSYISEVLHRAGTNVAAYGAAMESVHAHARVVLHFHPDRFGTKPIAVAEALLKEGVYRNQFETGLSTGGLSAFPGGARDSWERSLFGGAYHKRGISDSNVPSMARWSWFVMPTVRFRGSDRAISCCDPAFQSGPRSHLPVAKIRVRRRGSG